MLQQCRTAHPVLHRPIDDLVAAVHLPHDGFVLTLQMPFLPIGMPQQEHHDGGKY
ncbi:MAG: hypothetical protein IJV13_09890 [Prevotella sp.]|nr:hypothetical protein [Prevotella sp.]